MAAIDPNIALLDRLDEDYRRKDMEDFVDNLSYDGSETMEILQGFLDEAESQKPNPTCETILQRSYALTAPLSTTLALLGSEDGETVRRLVNELNQKQVEAQSLQLQLNHAKMQVEALIFSEQKHREDCERSNLHNATLQQDKLLLEVQLKKVAGFEGKNGRKIIEELRGKMLHAANQQLESLQHTHLTLQAESSERFHLLNQTIDTLTHDNDALQSRLSAVSDEIARNAILSAAQERRLNGTLTLQKYEFENRDKEFVSLQAKYELLSSQHTQLTQEQFQLHVEVKTLENDKTQLESLVDEKNEVLQSLQEQLYDVQTHNSSLENMLSNLRGSNLETVEINLLQQMENMRLQTRQKEDNMKEKLQQAFAQITLTAQQRDDTRQELEKRDLEVQQLKELLHQVQNNLHVIEHEKVVNHEFLVGKNEEKSRENHQQKMTFESLQNMSFNSVSSDDDQSCGNEDWIAQLTRVAHPHTTASDDDPHAGYISVKVLEWLNVVLSSLLKKQKESGGYSESQLRNSLMSFLQSKGIPHQKQQQDDDVYQQLIETLASTTGDSNDQQHQQQLQPMEDRQQVEEEYDYHLRIAQLEKENKGWRKFVNKILRKVAHLSFDSNQPPVDNLKLEIEGLQVENESLKLQISTLQDHLTYMKHEMTQLEEICTVQKDLGRYETAEQYDLQLRNLQSHIIQLETQAETNSNTLRDKDALIAELKLSNSDLEHQLEHVQILIRAVTLERDALLLKLNDAEHEMKFTVQMQIEDLQSTIVQSQRRVGELQAASQVIINQHAVEKEVLQVTLTSTIEELVIKTEELQAVNVAIHDQQAEIQRVSLERQVAMEALDITKQELTTKTEELESKNLVVHDQQVKIDRLSSALVDAAAAVCNDQQALIDEHVKEIHVLQAQIDDLQVAKEASQVMIDTQTAEIQSLQASLQATKEALQVTIHDQQVEIDRLSSALVSAATNKAAAEDHQVLVDEYVKKLQCLQVQIDDLLATKEASQMTIDGQLMQIDELQAAVNSANNALQETIHKQQVEIDRLSSSLIIGRETDATMIVNQQAIIDNLKTEIDHLTSSLTLSQQAQSTLTAQIEELQAANAHQAAPAAEITRLSQVELELQAQLEALQAKLIAPTTNIEARKKHIQELEQEKIHLLQQVDLLKQEDANSFYHQQLVNHANDDMEDLLVKEAILALESFTTTTFNPHTTSRLSTLDTLEAQEAREVAHEEHELSPDQITIYSLSTHNTILLSTLQQTQDQLKNQELQVQDMSMELTEVMDMEEMLRQEITVLEEANQQLLLQLDTQTKAENQELIALKTRLLQREEDLQQQQAIISALQQQLTVQTQAKEAEIQLLQSELTELNLRFSEEEKQNASHHLQLEAIKDAVQRQVDSANGRLQETQQQFQQVIAEQDTLHQQTIIEYQRRETELIETITLLEQQRHRHDEEQQTTEKEEEANLQQQLLQLQSQQVLLYQHLQLQTEENRRLRTQLTSRDQDLEGQKSEFETQQIELKHNLQQASQAEIQTLKSTLRKQFKHELSLREQLAQDTQSRLLDELNLIREKMTLLLTTQHTEVDNVIEVERHEIEVQTEENIMANLERKVQEAKVQSEELQGIIRRLEHDRNRLYQETLSLQQELTTLTLKSSIESIAVQTEDDNNNNSNNSSMIAIETAKELLKRQKLKLQKKHAHKLHLLEEAHILEKEHIIRLVRAECQEIVHETNHLLLAKKELVLQQQLVSETIAEISNRSMSLFSFSTPQRGPAHATSTVAGSDESLLNSSTSTSGGGLGHHHYTTAHTTPMTASTTANHNATTTQSVSSNNTTRAAFRYSNNSYNTNSSQSTIPVMPQQSQPAPGSISPITRRQSSSHHHQQSSSSSAGNHNMRSSFPFPIPSKTTSSLISSINVKDSAAVSSSGGVGVAVNKTVAAVASSVELYPEMLSPETTKQFVENLYKRSVE